MATFTSMSLVSSPAFKTKMFLTCTFKAQSTTFLHKQNWKVSCKPTRKLVRAQVRVPDDDKKLWQSVPDSIKNLEWKKAGDALQHQLVSLGSKVLEWSFISWFCLSCILETIYTISMNKELLMPLGLFAGCLLTDFVKEALLEFFGHSKATDLEWHFLGITGFWVLLKWISLLLPVQGRVFLAHVASGGLLQVLWLWRREMLASIDTVKEFELY